MSNLDEIDDFSLIVEEIGFEAEPMDSPVKEKPEKALDYAPTGNLDTKEKGENMDDAHDNLPEMEVNTINGVDPNNTEMIDTDQDGRPDGVPYGDERSQKEVRIDTFKEENDIHVDGNIYSECFENALHDPWKTMEVEDDEEFHADTEGTGVVKTSKKGVADLRNGYSGGKKNNRKGYPSEKVSKKKTVPGGPDDRKTRKGDDNRNSISGVQSKTY